MEDIDIYRTANVLIKQHGKDAKVMAAMQADACLIEGDLDGRLVWQRVIDAIAWLQEVDLPDAKIPRH